MFPFVNETQLNLEVNRVIPSSSDRAYSRLSSLSPSHLPPSQSHMARQKQSQSLNAGPQEENTKNERERLILILQVVFFRQ